MAILTGIALDLVGALVSKNFGKLAAKVTNTDAVKAVEQATGLSASGLIDALSGKQSPENAAALAELEKMDKALESQFVEAIIRSDEAQAAINLADAQSDSFWQKGWRPFIGWLCGVAILWHFFIARVMDWVLANIFDKVPVDSNFDIASLLTILGGILGLGTLRTAEKYMKGKNNA